MMRGGSNKAYRHPYLGVPSRAHVCGGRLHCVRETLVAGHCATRCPIVVIVPSVKTAVMRSRTIRRWGVLQCIRMLLLLLHKKCVCSVGGRYQSPQLLDLGHICRLTLCSQGRMRCLGLNESPCKITWSTRSWPIAPSSLSPISLILLLATSVRGRSNGRGTP